MDRVQITHLGYLLRLMGLVTRTTHKLLGAGTSLLWAQIPDHPYVKKWEQGFASSTPPHLTANTLTTT